MNDKFMKPIVPSGYAVPKHEIERLTEELRQARASELAGASDQDRARIEKADQIRGATQDIGAGSAAPFRLARQNPALAVKRTLVLWWPPPGPSRAGLAVDRRHFLDRNLRPRVFGPFTSTCEGLQVCWLIF